MHTLLQVALFDACDGFNCNPTCMIQILPGRRDETDGAFVWAVVLVTLVSAVLVLASGERHAKSSRGRGCTFWGLTFPTG